MPSYAHYAYPVPYGYFVEEVGVDMPPAGWTQRWGVNVTQAQQINEGAQVLVGDDGKLVVIPAVAPNDGSDVS